MAELKDRLRADLTESIRTGNELRTDDDGEDRWCHTTPRLAGDDCRPPYSAPHLGDPVEPRSGPALHPSLDSVFFISRPEPGPFGRREPHPPACDWRHVARRINDQHSKGAWTCALAARPASRAGGRRRRRHCGPQSPRYPGRSVDLTGRDHRLGHGPCRRCARRQSRTRSVMMCSPPVPFSCEEAPASPRRNRCR